MSRRPVIDQRTLVPVGILIVVLGIGMWAGDVWGKANTASGFQVFQLQIIERISSMEGQLKLVLKLLEKKEKE